MLRLNKTEEAVFSELDRYIDSLGFGTTRPGSIVLNRKQYKTIAKVQTKADGQPVYNSMNRLELTASHYRGYRLIPVQACRRARRKSDTADIFSQEDS